jgi:hypothetical protein
MINLGSHIKTFFLLIIIGAALASCSSTNNSTAISRNYRYTSQMAMPTENGIILAKVYDTRPEEEPSGLFDKVNKVLDKPRLMLAQSIRGKEVMAAQVVLLGPDNQKYYLGDYYTPDFRIGIKSDFGASERQLRKMKVGDKGDFQVYSGMPAYNLLSIPQGEYTIIASAFYDKKNTKIETFAYEPIYYKKFFLAAGEVLYIGDIAASASTCLTEDKFKQAKDYIEISHPEIAKKLVFKQILNTTK